MAYTEKDFNLSWGDITIGQANTLVVTRPSALYSFSFRYDFQGVSAAVSDAELTVVSQNDTRVVYSWTPEESLSLAIPDSVSGSGTLTMTVAFHSSIPQLSNPRFCVKTYAFTAYVPESMRPTATLQVTVVNDNAVVKGWNLCLQGLSRLQYTVKASGQGGASVKTCSFSFAGQTVTGASGTTALIGSAGTMRPSVTVTDSRGRTATVTGSAVKVYAYRQPVIADSGVTRCDADGVPADDGAYLKVWCKASCADVESRNTVKVRARYRPMGGGWSGYTTLSSGVKKLLGGGLAATASYEVELSAVDTVGSVRTVRYTASTSQVTLHLRSGGKGAAFGKYSETAGLECAWPAVFYGDAEVAGELTLGSRPLADVLWPVGSVRFTAEAVPPQPSPENAVWESAATGIEGLYAWRRTT